MPQTRRFLLICGPLCRSQTGCCSLVPHNVGILLHLLALLFGRQVLLGLSLDCRCQPRSEVPLDSGCVDGASQHGEQAAKLASGSGDLS